MPLRTVQIEGGTRVLVTTCEACGASAPYGEGVDLRGALRTGDVSKAGRWWCGWRDGQPGCVGRGKETTE